MAMCKALTGSAVKGLKYAFSALCVCQLKTIISFFVVAYNSALARRGVRISKNRHITHDADLGYDRVVASAADCKQAQGKS